MENNQTTVPATNTATSNVTGTVQTQAQQNVASNTSSVNYDEIFKKLDNILEKRSEGIAKSALKDNGLEDDDIKDVLSKYKTSKEAKTQEVDQTITTLKSENEKLKATMLKKDLDIEALNQARSLNVDDKTIPYLIKLADFKGAIDEKGTIVPDKVKTALEAVLNDVPSLKQAEKGTAGVQVGANASTSSQPSGNIFGFNFASVRGEKK